MKQIWLAATVLAAMTGHQAVAADAKPEREKCYGVAKTAKNDCASKDGAHSCAGLAKKDADANEWVYVPKGLCEKLAGGTVG